MCYLNLKSLYSGVIDDVCVYDVWSEYQHLNYAVTDDISESSGDLRNDLTVSIDNTLNSTDASPSVMNSLKSTDFSPIPLLVQGKPRN